MTDSLADPAPATRGTGHRGLHILLGVQSLVVVLVSVNRLGSATLSYVAPNEFLRWVDLNNLLLALVSLVAFYLLKQHLEYASPARDGLAHRGLGVAFIVGAFLLAASYGDHELTNYLHARFCTDGGPGSLCEIIVYHDDGFSHLVFFVGFTVINLVILLTQVVFPNRTPLTLVDSTLVAVNALFIGAGIFANLAFEEIGFDLYVVAAIAILAGFLLWRQPRAPILRYYAIAYGVGLAATAVAKLT